MLAILIRNAMSTQEPTALDQTPANQTPVLSSEEKKPTILKVISILFFALGSLYIPTTVGLLCVAIMGDLLVEYANGAESFTRQYPLYGVILLLFPLVTILFFYTAFKVKTGSKFAFILSIISFLSIFILPNLTEISIWSFARGVLFPTDSIASETVPLFVINFANLSRGELRGVSVLLGLVILLLLIISLKKFHFINQSLSKKAKIFLAIIALLFVLPTVSFVSFKFIEAATSDYAYAKAQSEVAYHIYKPSILPAGLARASKFTPGQELAGKQDAIRVVYDPPLGKMPKGGKIVGLQQVGIEPGFDLYSFISNASKVRDISTLQSIDLPFAANRTGYLRQAKLGESESYSNSLAYITTDNVLIYISSLNTSAEELMQFASSLK